MYQSGHVLYHRIESSSPFESNRECGKRRIFRQAWFGVKGSTIGLFILSPVTFVGFLKKRVLSDATRDDGFCNCLANNNFGHLPTFVAPDELTPGDESTTISDPDYSHVRVEA